MKITNLFFTCFLFFFFSFTTNAYPIFDTDGDILLNAGGPYRIGPVIWGPAGGDVKLATGTCPLDVVQDPFEVTIGDPFTFSSMLRIAILDSSYALLVSSPVSNPCGESTIWRVDQGREGIVTTGGSYSNGYCFRIANHPDPSISTIPSYMLEYCPSLCGASSESETCFPIRLYIEDGIRHLATSSDETTRPFEFVFKKVPEEPLESA